MATKQYDEENEQEKKKSRMRRGKGERVGGGRHRAVRAQQVRVQEQVCGEISRRRELEVFQWVVCNDKKQKSRCVTK